MKLFGHKRHQCADPFADAPPWAIELAEMAGFIIVQLSILLNLKENENMATKATLDALTASVAANTSAVQSASLALTGFVKSTADLTAALQAAIANSEASDDPDVKAAADAIAENNATLKAAIPAVSTAVAANTPAA